MSPLVNMRLSFEPSSAGSVSTVRSSLGDAGTDEGVGAAVGFTVGAGVGVAVGLTVGTGVGAAVGFAVGAGVGVAVGLTVDAGICIGVDITISGMSMISGSWTG